jgi:hypothetical protein
VELVRRSVRDLAEFVTSRDGISGITITNASIQLTSLTRESRWQIQMSFSNRKNSLSNLIKILSFMLSGQLDHIQKKTIPNQTPPTRDYRMLHAECLGEAREEMAGRRGVLAVRPQGPD